MSRAFVKEADGDSVPESLPERPQSPHINYVTPEGFRLLQNRVVELTKAWDGLAGLEDMATVLQRRQLERDLHYFSERVKRAVLVDPGEQTYDHVRFGAAVEVEDDAGDRQQFVIVGEDEADAGQGKISWVSPLAKALLNTQVGDSVIWRRPAGDKELEIIAIGRP